MQIVHGFLPGNMGEIMHIRNMSALKDLMGIADVSDAAWNLYTCRLIGSAGRRVYHTGNGRHESHLGSAQVGELTKKPNPTATAGGEQSTNVILVYKGASPRRADARLRLRACP